MAISRQQGITMLLIVLVGLVGGAAVLRTGHPEAPHADPHTAEAAKAAPAHHGSPGEPHDERRVMLSAAQLQPAGIAVQAAGPATLAASASFHGEIRLDEDNTSHVVPRLAGVAQAVSANLGQLVHKGQVLAVIASTALAEQRSALLTAQKRHELARSTYEREKQLWEDRISARQDYLEAQAALQEAAIAVQNASQKLAAIGADSGGSTGLNRLAIRAPLTGTVVEKHLSLGESVKEDASIFTVADLSRVWAEFAVAPKDLAAVRVGQQVVVSSTAFDSKAQGQVAYVGALLGEQTRTAKARVTLPNPQAVWRPGLFVTVTVAAPGDGQPVPIAVLADAVQSIGNEVVVFKAVPGGFVATPLTLGRSDGRVVEVVAGLQAGDRYAATRSFILKSELGKASAGHGH